MIAKVTFIKYYEYEVHLPDEFDDESIEAENFAVDEAEMEFRSDMRSPIADTTYDDVEVDWL